MLLLSRSHVSGWPCQRVHAVPRPLCFTVAHSIALRLHQHFGFPSPMCPQGVCWLSQSSEKVGKSCLFASLFFYFNFLQFSSFILLVTRAPLQLPGHKEMTAALLLTLGSAGLQAMGWAALPQPVLGHGLLFRASNAAEKPIGKHLKKKKKASICLFIYLFFSSVVRQTCWEIL